MLRVAAVCVLTLALASAALAAAPDADRTRAEQLVAEGLGFARTAKQLSEQGQPGVREAYRKAVEKFAEANRLYPHPEIQHNLARAHEELGELKSAHAMFSLALKQEYLYASDGRTRLGRIEQQLRVDHALLTVRATPSDANVRLVFADGTDATHLSTPFQTWALAGSLKVTATHPSFKTFQRELELVAGEDRALNLVLEPLPQQGFLQVTANVPGAKVFLSEVLVGTLPLATLTYPAGVYELKVTAKGYKPHKQQVIVTQDALVSVPVALEPLVAVGPGEEPIEDPGGGGVPSWVGATVIGVGAGAVVLGVVFHARAFKLNNDANQIPISTPPNPEDEAKYDDLFDRALDNQTYAWVTYGVAAALIGTGIVLLNLGGDDEDPADAPASSAGLRLVPTFGVTADGWGAGATLSF